MQTGSSPDRMWQVLYADARYLARASAKDSSMLKEKAEKLRRDGLKVVEKDHNAFRTAPGVTLKEVLTELGYKHPALQNLDKSWLRLKLARYLMNKYAIFSPSDEPCKPVDAEELLKRIVQRTFKESLSSKAKEALTAERLRLLKERAQEAGVPL